MNSNMGPLQAIWLALITLASTLIAIMAGAVIRFVGADLPTALGVGGAAFLGVVSLGLAVRRFLAG